MNSIGIQSQKASQKTAWKKLMYLKQPYPDNYTDESFLSQLKRNETVIQYSYFKLVKDFSLITFHVNNLILVIQIFVNIYYFNWNPIVFTTISSAISLLAFLVWEIKLNNFTSYTVNGSKLKSFVLIIFMILILSPVLRSLTRSTSSDSIWSISFLLTIANIVFHDYAFTTNIPQYKPIISTNISLSNALFLSSRLSSTFQVFCFIFLSIQLNILLPLLYFAIRQKSSNSIYQKVVFSTVFCLNGYYLFQVYNLHLIIFWVFTQVFISFMLPAYFMFLQKYKNELLGPWDIAKPIIKSN